MLWLRRDNLENLFKALLPYTCMVSNQQQPSCVGSFSCALHTCMTKRHMLDWYEFHSIPYNSSLRSSSILFEKKKQKNMKRMKKRRDSLQIQIFVWFLLSLGLGFYFYFVDLASSFFYLFLLLIFFFVFFAVTVFGYTCRFFFFCVSSHIK